MKAKLLTLACSSLFAMSAFAGTSVAIVDLNQAFQQAPQGAAAFNALKQQLAPEVTQLQTQQQSLQSQASKKMTDTQKAQLMAQQQSLQAKVDAFQKNATQQQQALLTSFGNAVKTDVAMIAKKQGYDVVLSTQDLIYNTSGVDITAAVIKQLNADAAAQASAASSGNGMMNQ